MTLSEELTWRGFVNQTTIQDITILDEKKLKFYWGVDPSASSMQIGNLAGAMMAKVFIKHGYTPVLLVGGATGLIGDPDGKAQERDLKTQEEVSKNKAGIAKQYEQIFSGQKFKIVDNYDWFKNINYLDFLRDVGKHVPMRQMLGRDFVQARLGEEGAGISYAEFSYSLIQAYDFLYLFETEGVTLQISGADQWGNSVAGVDLVRRKTGKEVHVWTNPLVVNKATGKKFGKTEDGAVWLDAKLTSVYRFYQFWLNVDDDGVEDYLKIYTTLDKDAITKVIDEFNSDRGGRAAQKLLAYEVTKLIHGEDAANKQVKIADALFKTRDFKDFTAADFKELEAELPFAEVSLGDSYEDVLVKSGLVASKSEGRRLIQQGAVNHSGEFTVTSDMSVETKDLIDGYMVIIKGKKHFAVARVK